MSIRRLLPLEVQAVILGYLGKPSSAPSLTRATRAWSRASSTTAFSSSDLFASAPSTDAAAPAPPASSRPSPATVFEEPSEEYASVPLSTLDHPPSARTPDVALLALLRTNQRPSALSLLDSFESSAQAIPHRVLFGRYALRAIRADPADRAWMRWWALVPSVTDPLASRETVRERDKIMVRKARAMLEAVFAAQQSGLVEVDLVVEFATLLARQGHVRLVAERVLRRWAVYQPPGIGEALLETCLAELRRQKDALASSPHLAGVRAFKQRRRQGRRILRRGRRAPREWITRYTVDARRLALMRWYHHRTRQAYYAVVRARGASIVAHANLGRLGLAVELVTQTHPSLDGVIPLRLPYRAFTILLGRAAAQDRFDLFSAVFDKLEQTGRRLVRIRNPAQRSNVPYFVRTAANALAAGGVPTVLDAFTSYRDRHVVSPIEEGEGLFEAAAPAVAEGETDAALSSLSEVVDDSPRAADPSKKAFARLARSIAAGDLGHAVPAMVGFLGGSEFPPAPLTASFLTLLHERGPDVAHAVLGRLQPFVQLSAQTRGHWTTATMLACVQRGDFADALLAFKGHYDTAALPQAVSSALALALDDAVAPASAAEADVLEQRARAVSTGEGNVTSKGEAGALEAKPERYPPSAYTFAVFMQALVGLFEARIPPPSPADTGAAPHSPAASEARARIWSLYRTLVSLRSNKWNVVPSISRRDARKSSPLSPYTFTPFLRFHLRHRSPPRSLVDVLVDMTGLGIQPPLPHYAVTLNSYARFGDPVRDDETKERAESVLARQTQRSNDLLFLLFAFSSPASAVDPTSALAAQASPSLVELFAESSIALPTAPLNAAIYTGVLAGLRKRGERDVARRVVEQVAEERAEEVKRWVQEDERFRREVRWAVVREE
ncbi:hypothetical protein JCM10207_004169 [Rhodosporidiobolus poonsookiae]